MKRILSAGLCLMFVAACRSPSSNGNPDGGDGDGGTGTGPAFAISVLNNTPTDREPLAMTIYPDDRVGVAYYVKVGVDPNNPTNGIYQLRYLEWQSGTGVLLDELVDTVERIIGVGLAVQPNGQPAVSYLGGNDSTQAYWFQNDAYLAYRTGTNAWSKDVVAQNSSEITNGNSFSTSGMLVGLHSSIAFDSSGKAWYAYRDCHWGQSAQGDYNGSNLDVASGAIGSWTSKLAVIGSDGTVVGKQGYGGHNTLLIANGYPALVSDQIPAVADTTTSGINVTFERLSASGTWSPLKTLMNVNGTSTGPSFAFDPNPSMGYGIAVMELGTGTLWFLSSADGNTWNTPDPVWQSGTGGWYPSLAIDPTYHEPEIAYYYCDNRTGISDGSCRASDDELRIDHRVAGNWRTDAVVDPNGGYLPKLGFLSTGKRVVVYRNIATSGAQSAILQLAVEQ